MVACLKMALIDRDDDFLGESPVFIISITFVSSGSCFWMDFHKFLSPIGRLTQPVKLFMTCSDVAAMMHGLVSLVKRSERQVVKDMHDVLSGMSDRNLSTTQSLE